MNKKLLIIILLSIIPTLLLAEYRAYQIEVFNHLEKKKWEVQTGFAPDQFVQIQGYPNHYGVLLKATWMCYGDTGAYKKVCPKPKTKNPKFQQGDTVQVSLEKHITDQWKGEVEIAYYREDLRSNVYGIRFKKRRNLYSRYFEKDLKLIQKAEVKKSPDVKKK